MTIREGNRVMRVTALEAYVRRLRANALSNGSIRAGREWLELSSRFGALFSQPDTAEIMPANHNDIVARFRADTRRRPARRTSRAGSSAPALQPKAAP